MMTFFTYFSLHSQDKEVKKNSTFYREDQIYFGASFMVLTSNQEQFKPKGLSRHFQLGLVRDIPLIDSGKLSTGIGFGLGFDRYTTNLIPLDRGIYSLYNVDADLNNSLYLSVKSLELPISFRWRSSTATNFAFWRLYGGISLQWNYNIKAKQNSNLIEIFDEIKKLGSTAHISFGYNTWNFFLSYSLKPIFNSLEGNSEGLPIQIKPLKIGLIFYVL